MLEGESGPLPLESVGRAGRSIPAGSGREVPPEVLDSIRGLPSDQLVNMLTNYYHSIRGGYSNTASQQDFKQSQYGFTM